jgi:phytoene/squalene synthetase
VSRYDTWDDVFDYCVNSANPVGHLVLYLCGYRDAERQRLSDATCTALQLANFWQDITIDIQKNRVYLPLSVLSKHGYGVEDLFAQRFNNQFEQVMREAVSVADGLFARGLPLIRTVDRRLAFDLELFSRGGMCVLSKIRSQGYNVLKARPAVSKWERIAILLGCLPRLVLR